MTADYHKQTPNRSNEQTLRRTIMKSIPYFFLILVIFHAINLLHNNELKQLIKAQQPKAVELSYKEEANFYHYQDLVLLTIKKAAKFDEDPTDFSFKDQKELLNYIQKHCRKTLILTEGHPLSLKARWPKEGEDMPRIFLKLSPTNEVHIYYGTFLSYTGYKKLGDWIDLAFY